MVVISAIWTAIVDIERLVGEWFLRMIIVNNDGRCGEECTHVATMAIETVAMIFPFQLTVRGGYRLFFYRQITTAALMERR